MNSGAPPPVIHAINCLCMRCIAARQEEAAGRETAALEAMVGPVTARLGLTLAPIAKNRKLRRGSVEALRALGRRGW